MEYHRLQNSKEPFFKQARLTPAEVSSLETLYADLESAWQENDIAQLNKQLQENYQMLKSEERDLDSALKTIEAQCEIDFKEHMQQKQIELQQKQQLYRERSKTVNAAIDDWKIDIEKREKSLTLNKQIINQQIQNELKSLGERWSRYDSNCETFGPGRERMANLFRKLSELSQVSKLKSKKLNELSKQNEALRKRNQFELNKKWMELTAPYRRAISQSIKELPPSVRELMANGGYYQITRKHKAVLADLKSLEKYLIRECGKNNVSLAELEQYLDARFPPSFSNTTHHPT